METKDDSVHFREDIVTQLRDLDTRLKQALNVQDTTLIQSFTLQFDYLLRSAILYWRSPGNGLVPLLAEFQLLSLNYLKKDKLQLLKYLGDCTHRTLQIVDAASKPTEREVVIPFASVEGTRQYIEQIVQQVNGCYVSGWYDACAVMTRRLVETLIIEAFEAHKIESKIKDSNGDYLYLKDLVVRALEESTWNLSRNVKKALPRLKDIGNQAATSSALADGNSHYFHIRSVDNAGNWQSTVHLGPVFIDTTPPSILGTTHEVNCDILPSTTVEAFKGDVSKGSTVSDPTSGDYTLSLPETGDYDIVASKAGFRNETQSISITGEGTYTLNFRGEHGLIPNAPDMSYVLGCINAWLYPPPPCGLSMSKVLAVINAWLYPT